MQLGKNQWQYYCCYNVQLQNMEIFDLMKLQTILKLMAIQTSVLASMFADT